jgi:fructose/tagatose bisphosphate aldolase
MKITNWSIILTIFPELLEQGTSVMVDGSRLTLSENIAAVREVVALAHCNDVPVEAELGAVIGHESGLMPNYEKLFATGKGFTNTDDAEQFIRETAVDWLSVAVGSVHAAIAPTLGVRRKSLLG